MLINNNHLKSIKNHESMQYFLKFPVKSITLPVKNKYIEKEHPNNFQFFVYFNCLFFLFD
ncbi:MAG: hypothetical protein DRI94_05650 [Bacteroidetes bacterium]|nr:MAG: hypothetical protein DRI94_05650 [Bacteroidota bacterium]